MKEPDGEVSNPKRVLRYYPRVYPTQRWHIPELEALPEAVGAGAAHRVWQFVEQAPSFEVRRLKRLTLPGWRRRHFRPGVQLKHQRFRSVQQKLNVPPFVLHKERLVSFIPGGAGNPFSPLLLKTNPRAEKTADWLADRGLRSKVIGMLNAALREHCYHLGIHRR